MKKLIAYSLPLIALILSGCVVRTIPYEQDRVDQELTGNRGIVTGNVPEAPIKERKRTKKMYKIEVELPSSLDKKDKDTSSGNRGYVGKREVSERKTRSITRPSRKPAKGEILRLKGSGASSMPQVVYHKSTGTGKKYKKEKGSGALKVVKQKGLKTYVVKEGDTLQKISRAMYGTTKKWKKIFEANKNVLDDPDKIKPGLELVIPEL